MARTVSTGWRKVTPGRCSECGSDCDYGVDGRGTVLCSCSPDFDESFDTTDASEPRARGYWTIGVGQVGCLYNHTESAEDLDSVLDVATELYELTTAQRNELRWNKIVYFEGEQRATNGDLIELFHQDGELPEEDC